MVGDAFEMPLHQVYALLLIFSRISSFMVLAPLFRGRNVPTGVKMGLSLLISFLLRPGIVLTQPLAATTWGLLVLVAKEMAIGLSIGFFIQLFFFAVGMAGQLIDVEMGFHMANILEPLSGSQLPLIGNLFSMVFTLLYLSIHGHLLLLKALVESFQLLPLGSFLPPAGLNLMVEAMTGLLALAVQIALPVIGASLFTSIIFGILAKSVPQMNVFIVGMPLKVAIVSALLVVVMPGLMGFMEHSLGDLFLNLGDWLSAGISP